jgi:hypothetical protein
VLGFVSRGLANPDTRKGKNEGNGLESKENNTRGEAHGK